MNFLALCLMVFLTGNGARAAIFGLDNRLAISPQSPQAELARSTAVAVLSANFQIVNGKINLTTTPMKEFVCEGNKFSNDPSLSYACTGFLVAPDLLATAGHCMVNTGESRHETQMYCEVFSWLFDFSKDSFGTVATENIDPAKLFGCKQIIYAIREEVPPYRDFALVQLDRPALDRFPVKLSADELKNQDTYSTIGYPLGTPAKLSPNGKILLNNRERESFLTNLDAFEGNSGSPVFNGKKEVVGILVAGTPSISLVNDPAKTCQHYNSCDENGENCRLPDANTNLFPGFQRIGTEVQRIAPLKELVDTHLKSIQ